MKLKNLPFRLESQFFRAWHAFWRTHPISDQYLSGDAFRALTPWVYEPDSRHRFDPLAVPRGALIFCDGWILNEFLTSVAPRLPGGHCLISHNADPNLTDETAALVPSTVERVYGMNVLTRDPRFVAVPIGLENGRWHYNGVVRDFVSLRRQSVTKKPRILVAFTVGTNPVVRNAALTALSPLVTVDRVERVNSRAYRKIAHRYQFIASPPGNGADCHRTWEALYLQAVPIVLRSAMTESFLALGLPLWMVDSYEELVDYDEAGLDRKYHELMGAAEEVPALWMDAWRIRIRERR